MTSQQECQIFKNDKCSDKVRLDYLEIHTNTLDLYLFAIITWWLFNSKSVNLAIYLPTVAIVSIEKYKEGLYNERKLLIHMYFESLW